MGTSLLLPSSLMPTLLESRQITPCRPDFTSGCDAVDAADDDTCFDTSPGEKDRHDAADKEGTKKGKEDERQEGKQKKDKLVISLYAFWPSGNYMDVHVRGFDGPVDGVNIHGSIFWG